MSKPVFIGLGGLLRSGKDTAADHLVIKHGFVKMGMSDPLHESMMALNPIVKLTPNNHEYARYRDMVNSVGYVEAKKIPEVRRLLQAFGTEVVRDIIDPDSWVKIAERRILAHLEAGTSVALTGIRFPNELALVNRLGTSVWVDRPGLESAGTHASEGSVGKKDFSLVVPNYGTLKDLFKATNQLANWLKGESK